MKTFIIKVNPLKMPNFGNYSTFQEEFEKYARKCKKKAWATPEGFSLEFVTTLQDLKDSVFVRPISDEEEAIIRKRFKILEECEM
jgi:hypothetical protein